MQTLLQRILCQLKPLHHRGWHRETNLLVSWSLQFEQLTSTHGLIFVAWYGVSLHHNSFCNTFLSSSSSHPGMKQINLCCHYFHSIHFFLIDWIGLSRFPKAQVFRTFLRCSFRNFHRGRLCHWHAPWAEVSSTSLSRVFHRLESPFVCRLLLRLFHHEKVRYAFSSCSTQYGAWSRFTLGLLSETRETCSEPSIQSLPLIHLTPLEMLSTFLYPLEAAINLHWQGLSGLH